jgi:hypothetical protein
VLTVSEADAYSALGLAAGQYLALMSHSGSRGAGAAVCDHYSRIAMDLHPTLDKQHKHLAWLDLDSQPGREYWDAMNLMGRYASANHACIHHHIAENLRAGVIAGVENHHNFAWEERHAIDGVEETLIVHRKGATPAGEGVLGVIPGPMADPAFIVVGKDGPGSLSSASHGAGRVMSRTAAKNTFRWPAVRALLKERGVTVISAGIDENPGSKRTFAGSSPSRPTWCARWPASIPNWSRWHRTGRRRRIEGGVSTSRAREEAVLVVVGSAASRRSGRDGLARQGCSSLGEPGRSLAVAARDHPNAATNFANRSIPALICSSEHGSA